MTKFQKIMYGDGKAPWNCVLSIVKGRSNDLVNLEKKILKNRFSNFSGHSFLHHVILKKGKKIAVFSKSKIFDEKN